jgi:predicted small lipoprotein YifL
MDLPLRRGRTPVLLLALALALVGCGGVPKGPILPGEAPRAPVPEDSQARAASLTRLGDTALRSGDTEAAVSLFEQATLTDGGNAAPAVGPGTLSLPRAETSTPRGPSSERSPSSRVCRRLATGMPAR